MFYFIISCYNLNLYFIPISEQTVLFMVYVIMNYYSLLLHRLSIAFQPLDRTDPSVMTVNKLASNNKNVRTLELMQSHEQNYSTLIFKLEHAIPHGLQMWQVQVHDR